MKRCENGAFFEITKNSIIFYHFVRIFRHLIPVDISKINAWRPALIHIGGRHSWQIQFQSTEIGTMYVKYQFQENTITKENVQYIYLFSEEKIINAKQYLLKQRQVIVQSLWLLYWKIKLQIDEIHQHSTPNICQLSI